MPIEENRPETGFSDELIADLAAFAAHYAGHVRAAVIKNIGSIAADPTLVCMLHEYHIRQQEERDEMRRDYKNCALYGHDFIPTNCSVTHSHSYRDVLYDLLKPYWDKPQVETAVDPGN